MTELEELRKKIETITIEMLSLLKTRTEIAQEIVKIKNQQGMSVSNESRENELRELVKKECQKIGFETNTALKFLNFLLNESVKVQSLESNTHLAIFLKAKELERQGKKIIHLEVGEPDFQPPINVKKSLSEVYDKGFGKYGPAKGLPEFRTKLAEFANNNFGAKVNLENVMVTPGSRFGVFLAISTLLDAGDEIIVIEPAWPAYGQCAINSGIKVRIIKTTLENRWEPDLKEISSCINENTKMIVLNYPNNPTGKILPRTLQDQIVEIAKKNNLYILSDEVYSNYSNEEWNSILSYDYEKSIVSQSFSKSHSMTGYRIGYLISSKNIIDRLTKLQALCLTNVSEPIQYTAMKSLDDDITGNREIISQRLTKLEEICKKMELEFVRPDGAMYIFARTKNQINTSKLSEELLNHGVAIAPGIGFGDYNEFFRISACLDIKTLIEGMDILKTRL
ncbi:MAG: aminotransferase class I/II-fold pyridoxal phosphate-dependent enzyme [Crenarchaeota archaeon]|nr:aminotransferase class I/II-fold pyridoxal phosphate-dependent enzyme [Thermoproteota archaeon]MDA1124524.1 aminotransferase class I/II-fold pyridoxal phosphate-dependent enzyme [Thermoproteota archaeon]